MCLFVVNFVVSGDVKFLDIIEVKCVIEDNDIWYIGVGVFEMCCLVK